MNLTIYHKKMVDVKKYI